MPRLLQIGLIFFVSYSLEIHSEEACGITFERDCSEKDIYLLIDESNEADRDGDLLLYQELHKKVKIRCEEAISEHLKLVCRGYAFQDRARSAETELSLIHI